MALFQDQKGKNIINYQKMINEKKDTIRKYYDEIGHLYYGQYKDMNIDVTKDINARCESISNIYKDIEELNKDIVVVQQWRLDGFIDCLANTIFSFSIAC